MYVDPSTKQAALSLLPHLQTMSLPSPTPMLSQLFEAAKVRRVHSGLGLLLELPLGPEEEGAAMATCAGEVGGWRI